MAMLPRSALGRRQEVLKILAAAEHAGYFSGCREHYEAERLARELLMDGYDDLSIYPYMVLAHGDVRGRWRFRVNGSYLEEFQ
jgi:hypothetical protein